MVETVRLPVAKTERERLDMRLDPDIRRRAEVQAERYQLSLSAYIRQALVARIERDEEEEPPKLGAKPPRR